MHFFRNNKTYQFDYTRSHVDLLGRCTGGVFDKEAEGVELLGTVSLLSVVCEHVDTGAKTDHAQEDVGANLSPLFPIHAIKVSVRAIDLARNHVQSDDQEQRDNGSGSTLAVEQNKEGPSHSGKTDGFVVRFIGEDADTVEQKSENEEMSDEHALSEHTSHVAVHGVSDKSARDADEKKKCRCGNSHNVIHCV